MRSEHPTLFLSRKEKKKIIESIREAEMKTSGEIHVHLAQEATAKVIDRTTELFESLGMTKTKHRNGVLILLSIQSKQFAIIGDSGIHEKVPNDFWNQIVEKMSEHFKQNHFADGIIEAILMTGEKLKTYFPRQPDDRNELSNKISYSRT